jgi:hypothetical protein
MRDIETPADNNNVADFDLRKKAYYSGVAQLTLQNIDKQFFVHLEFAQKLADPHTACVTLAKKCFDLSKTPQIDAKLIAKLKNYAYIACDAVAAGNRHFPAAQLIMGKIVLEKCVFDQSPADRIQLAQAITHLLRSTDKGRELGLEMLEVYSGTNGYSKKVSLVGIENPAVLRDILQLAEIAFRIQQTQNAEPKGLAPMASHAPAASVAPPLASAAVKSAPAGASTPAPLLTSYNAQPKKPKNPLLELAARQFTWDELLSTLKLEGADLNEVDPNTGNTAASTLFTNRQNCSSPAFLLDNNFLEGLFRLGAKPNNKWWTEGGEKLQGSWAEVTWEFMKANLTTDGKPAAP